MLDGSEEERRSPLSFICAKLADALNSQANARSEDGKAKVFAVTWFCGEHTDTNTDFDAQPLGMLNSSISQLLMQISSQLSLDPDFYLDIPHLLDLDPDFQSNNVGQLCRMFSDLIVFLPRNIVVFYIIDGIVFYEAQSWYNDLVTVLDTILSLVNLEESGCLIKLLTTTPLQSHEVQQMLFTQDSVLNMESYIPENGGFTSLQWSTKVGWMGSS